MVRVSLLCYGIRFSYFYVFEYLVSLLDSWCSLLFVLAALK